MSTQDEKDDYALIRCPRDQWHEKLSKPVLLRLALRYLTAQDAPIPLKDGGNNCQWDRRELASFLLVRDGFSSFERN